MATFISTSPEETLALGAQWGRAAQPGWLIGLSVDLGAGKTQLVKGLARGLGITDLVRSPTFALVHQYAGGRLPLVHLDFYRLDTPEQIQGAGLDEFLNRFAGLTVVEWIERWWGKVQGPAFEVPSDPSDPSHIAAQGGIEAGVQYRHVRIECLSESERRISYEDFGA